MKKAWESPVIEVLNVKETEASTVYGPYTDEAYIPGVPVEDIPPDTNRFTS